MKKVSRMTFCMIAVLGCILLSLSGRAAAAGEYRADVYDLIDGMSLQQEEQLRTEAQYYADQHCLDLVFVLTDETYGLDSMHYADDFYDAYHCPDNTYAYGPDGILFLIDLDNQYNYISTKGEAITQLTDREIDWVLTDADGVASTAYAECFSVMLKSAIRYFEDTTDNYSDQFCWSEALRSTFIGFFIASFIGLFVFSSVKAKKKKAHMTLSDNSVVSAYFIGEALEIRSKNEHVTGHNTRVLRGYYADNDSGRSFGGGSSGSFHGGSSHISSSGASHGGGGHHR